MAFHDKIAEAGNEAVGAWARMIAWSCGARTDGQIPISIAKAIAGRPGLIRHMVEHQLVDAFDVKTGAKIPTTKGRRLDKNHLILRVHDHLEWNPSAEESEAISKKKSHAGKLGAAKKWGKTDGTSHGKTIADPDPDPDPITRETGANGSGLMLGDINSRLEAEFGPRGFITSKWQPRLRSHLPYAAAEVESAIMEAKAADPDGAGGGLVASILIRYRKQPAPKTAKRSSGQGQGTLREQTQQALANLEKREPPKSGEPVDLMGGIFDAKL